MGVILENPDTTFFAKVPCLGGVSQKFKEIDGLNLIMESGLGQIFVNHGVWDTFGICLVHRHFSMEQNEILVDTMNKEIQTSAAIPWKIFGKKATPAKPELDIWSSYQLQEGKYIHPRTWGNDATTGVFKAFEFFTSDEYEQVLPTPEFLLDFLKKLKLLGLECVIGVRLLDQNYPEKWGSWETTPTARRANVTQYAESMPPGLEDTDMVKIGWKFDANGELDLGAAECGNCCSRCGSCFICS